MKFLLIVVEFDYCIERVLLVQLTHQQVESQAGSLVQSLHINLELVLLVALKHPYVVVHFGFG